MRLTDGLYHIVRGKLLNSNKNLVWALKQKYDVLMEISGEECKIWSALQRKYEIVVLMEISGEKMQNLFISALTYWQICSENIFWPLHHFHIKIKSGFVGFLFGLKIIMHLWKINRPPMYSTHSDFHLNFSTLPMPPIQIFPAPIVCICILQKEAYSNLFWRFLSSESFNRARQ